MAKYTFTLRELCLQYGRDTIKSWFEDYELSNYLTAEQIEVVTENGVFDKSYLSDMIIDHYYMYESGLETPGLFKLKAAAKMREIMCKYAQIIYSAAIKFDPLVNVDYTETFNRNIANTATGTSTGENNSNTTANASGLTVNSDTPQGQINKTDILNGKYASSTSASESTSQSDATSNSSTNTNDSSTSDENYTRKTKGNSGVSATAQALIMQYRKMIEPINYDIIEEINDLFMIIF